MLSARVASSRLSSQWAGLLAAVWLLAAPVAFGQQPIALQYLYDDAGQLTRVVDSTGVVIEYVYDAVGNMLEVRRTSVSTTQLTILGFAPAQGGPGTSVRIQGVGFSAVPTDNVVLFNGVRAAVSSVTANTIVARVPTAASTGPISVTVSSNTATTNLPFTVLALPVITSVTPRSIDSLRPPASVTVRGVNLTAAQFRVLPGFVPSPLTLGTPQVDTSGTSATLPVTVSPSARGTFVLVATNSLGASDSMPSSGNTVSILNVQDDADSDGDGVPDGLEIVFGTDPLSADSVPTFTERGDLLSAVSVNNTTLPFSIEQTLTSQVSVLNVALPPGIERTQVGSVSVLNNVLLPGTTATVTGVVSVVNTFVTPQTPQMVVSPAFSVQNLLPSRALPQISELTSRLTTATAGGGGGNGLGIELDAGLAGRRLIEGQTVVVGANVRGGRGTETVTFTVNGVPLATDSAAPYGLTFTVPSGVLALVFGASIRDAGGAFAIADTVALGVERDLGTVVSGRVLDAGGNPVRGAIVELLSQGLQAEYFDASLPLTSLPDLTGATPTRASRVTAINMRTPGGVFGVDPFGTGLAPDYAARFTGWLAIAAAGSYTFSLGADEGARLRVGGTTVVDMPTGAGGFQEHSGSVTLDSGLVPLEIAFYESTGSAELQLSFVPPGGSRQVVPPSAFVAPQAPFVAVTDDSGRFALRGVPTVLTGVRVRATFAQGGPRGIGVVELGGPMSPDLVDVGDVVLLQR